MTYQAILDLFKIVKSLGDTADLAGSKLRRYNKALSAIETESSKLAKRANTRLKALEERGLTSSPAYQRATWWTGDELSRMRFSESKKLSPDKAIEQLEELNAFLGNEYSTISGETARQAGLEKLMPEGTKKEKAAMKRFLESDAFSEMKKVIGTDIVKKAADAIEAGAKVGELNKLYRDYLTREAAGRLTVDQDIYTEVWSEWTGEE